MKSFMTTIKLIKIISYTFLATIGVISIYSCKESQPLNNNVSNASIRVWNAVPDIRSVAGLDYRVDNQPKGTSIYKQDELNYQQVLTGERIFQLFASGTTTLALENLLSFDENRNYTVLALGSASTLSVRFINDNLPSSINPDSLNNFTVVRFLHLSPDTQPISVGIIDTNRVITPVFALTPFIGRDDSAAFRTTYRYLRLRSADTTFNFVAIDTVGRRDTIPLASINLKQKSVYTLIARGFIGAQGAQGLEFVSQKER
jgi:hypothetical protein